MSYEVVGDICAGKVKNFDLLVVQEKKSRQVGATK